MQEEVKNYVDVIRSVKRSDLTDVRNKHRENILGNKRVRLQEVSEYVQDVTLSEFNELLSKLKQKSVPVELLRKIKNSCVNTENIEAVFKNDGAFNALIRLLIGNDAQKQLEAAACITNLSCGPHKCSYKVAKASGAYLVSFINGRSHFLQDQSAWTLANIANDCLECFNIIKSQGALSALLKAFKSPLSDAHSLAFAINACTKYDDPEVSFLTQSGLPEHLLLLLERSNLNSFMFLDAAFALSNCCFFSIKYSFGVFDVKIVERIINILMKACLNSAVDILIVTPLVRCIGFLSYDDKICEFLASHSDFYKIIQIVTSAEGYVHLIKETVWILSNVAASTDISSNITDLMPLINNFSNILKLKKLGKSPTLEVLYYLLVLATKNEHVYKQLAHHEIFVQIKSLLESEEKHITDATRVFLKLYSNETSVEEIKL